MYSKNSGSPFVVGTTRVYKQLLDQNGAVLQTCSFDVTILDKDAPVITDCPGDIAVNNTTDSCGAVVSFNPPAVYEPCTLQRKDFYFTGAPATFIVPPGVTSIDVDVRGAQGGRTFYNNSVYGNPGLGGMVYATIPVTPGQMLTINVGGAGHNGSVSGAGAGGFNGGGNGTAGTDENGVTVAAGGGGGGATDIRTGTALTDRILVAGGGGAHGFNQNGGDGGGDEGAHGALAHRYDVNGADGTYYATGGTQTEGGTGGIYQNGDNGGNGSLGVGGDGAAGTFAGGGGGGYYGGGGGSYASGAGGSGYIYDAAANAYNGQGGQEGDGFVNFTYDQPATLVQTAGLPSGALFPVGETLNTFTATDASGNTSNCTFKVIVTDNQKPIVAAPANISVNANNGCAATGVTLGSPVVTDNCGVASATNNAPATFPVGTTTVTWTVTDIHGNMAQASQTVIVTDQQKPVLAVPADQTFSATTSGSYTIPSLGATDNCGIASITYHITGATTRSGTGANASGSFGVGNSVITFTVTDIHGNVETGTTTVHVTAAPVTSINVTIPDVYAVNPGGKPNTIYIGYGPSYVTLKAVVSDGKSPYTYEWTINGFKLVIGRSQTLPVILAGNYTVTVKDAKGATGSYTKQIQVVDVRCGNKDDKVTVCVPGKGHKNASTDCVNENKVDDLLDRGGFLGDCTSASSTTSTSLSATERVAETEDVVAADTTAQRIAVQAKPEVIASSINKLSVYPNPASGHFSVQLNNYKASKVDLFLLSENGRTVQRKTVTLTGTSTTVQINTGGLAPGVYLVKVVGEEGIQVTKVILQH